MDEDYGVDRTEEKGGLSSSSLSYVTTGQIIGPDSGFLRGHGTIAVAGKLKATVSGFVQRVNKLVSVQALNSRYQGEIGDVVVCRVLEVADKRWRADCNSRQNAVLHLASVHLPGGVQRRRTQLDMLNMRNYFVEGDLISAEVQQILSDGAISLHTRSLKYGKLHNGTFLSVPASLIKRCKQHFHTLDIGVEIILGNNGYIWLQKSRKIDISKKGRPNEGGVVEEKGEGPGTSLGAKDREKICRVRNSIVALSKMFLAIYLDTIMEVYNQSLEMGLTARDVIDPAMIQAVTEPASARIRANAGNQE